MSDATDIMFTPDGRPAPLLVRKWRAKGASRGLAPLMVLVSGGYATRAFRGVWRAAFPDRDPLPTDAVATRDMRFTQAMLDVWA